MLVVGAMIVVVAAYGYEFVAKVANIAAPWMVLVFVAFGMVGLRQFIDATGTQVHSLADFWTLAKTQIWKGGDPLPGQVKFTFWHVMFFAWFCNMAMHIGMSDLSVFRFAQEILVRPRLGGRHVPRPLHGLDRRLDPLRRPAAPGPGQHRRAARPARLPGLRPGRPALRDRRRLDHGQSDHLPRRPGLPGDHAASRRASRSR